MEGAQRIAGAIRREVVTVAIEKPVSVSVDAGVRILA